MIVVGYTPDVYGRAALEHAITESRVRDTAVTVLNATKGDALADPRFADSTDVGNLEEILGASGISFVVEQDVSVDPVDALLDAMDRDDAELLVIGIRHRSPVGKLLMGSTAQRLLLACPKPVLAVKPALVQ
ncbi:universal stress protein [Williamsia maris]|uniref:Universal stress protein family protein n=1 Tax=Williamsia maris TaxID=72806 RepID=A0ABT1HGG0_9NOCA|nr:universal stress protein [Williamsia maris]MCP2175996.1 Universal stress protein family protein [Williamsia maris]